MKLSDCYSLGYISRVSKEGKLGIHLDEILKDYKNLESVMIQMNKSDQTLVPFFLDKKMNRLNKLEFKVVLEQNPTYLFSLKGKRVFLPRTEPQVEEDNKFSPFHVIGFQVEDQNHGHIGEVVEFYDLSSHPIIGVKGKSENEILIPFVEDIILAIDEVNKQVVVKVPEGLIDLYIS